MADLFQKAVGVDAARRSCAALGYSLDELLTPKQLCSDEYVSAQPGLSGWGSVTRMRKGAPSEDQLSELSNSSVASSGMSGRRDRGRGPRSAAEIELQQIKRENEKLRAQLETERLRAQLKEAKGTKDDSKRQQVCRQHRLGTCSYGTACRYLHSQ